MVYGFLAIIHTYYKMNASNHSQYNSLSQAIPVLRIGTYNWSCLEGECPADMITNVCSSCLVISPADMIINVRSNCLSISPADMIMNWNIGRSFELAVH